MIAKREQILDVELLKEVKDSAEEPIYSRTRDTKYFWIDETYWLVKTLVAQALEKTREDQ